MVHTAVAFGEDDFRLGERYGLKLQNPVREDGTFDERAGPFAGRFVKDADADIVEALRESGRLLRAGGVRARLPALLALRHAAHLLREVELVRPHHRGPRRPPARERGGDLVPGAHQARPLRQVAREQRRLGAVARALLGHAAARLALRPGSRPVRGVDRRAARPRRERPGRPPQALHRRGLVRLPGVRRGDAPRARGHRRLVGLRLDAVRPVARPVRERGHLPGPLPRRLHLRGRWTRRAGGSTRCWRCPRSSTAARRTRPCSAWA